MASALTQKSLVLIFSYAPMGFGHLRVTDALYDGLPEGANPLLLGAQDQSLTTLYRFVSIHPITRWIMDWFQEGIGESIFAFFSRAYFRNNTTLLDRQMITILSERIDVPKTVLVIATHFTLAHQLVIIKQRLEKENNIHIILVVQVTDDSPQKLWYVDGADLLVVPSQRTKQALEAYAKSSGLTKTEIIVNAYPISPLLSKRISEENYAKRVLQVNSEHKAKVHILIPLSGAAVGTSFFTHFIETLHTEHERYSFHIIAKKAPYTQMFFKQVLTCNCVDLHVSEVDREVITMYEEVYEKEVISLEVTKPSEQAFKALLQPHQMGGSILLLADPVGRQEEDNLNFLRRHHLIPGIHETEELWQEAKENNQIKPNFSKQALHWRGVILPKNPIDAANFVTWGKRQNLFYHMMHKKREPESDIEVQPDGVKTFWKKVQRYVKTHEN